MTSFAALAVLVAAQGSFNPPTGPIIIPPTLPKFVNRVANPGFENGAFSPWTTYGDVYRYNADGSVQYAPNSFGGKVIAYGTGHVFDLAIKYADVPGDPRPYGANLHLKQTFSTQPKGSSIIDASASISNWGSPLSVTIEYTSGSPTNIGAPNTKDSWAKWNFIGGIDPNRYVKSITFNVDGAVITPGNHLYDSARLDDVSILVIAPK